MLGSFWFLGVFGLSFAITLALVLGKRWHARWTSRRDDLRAVQAAHDHPVPRIGSLPIMLPFLGVLFVLGPRLDAGLAAGLALSVLPVLAAGLLEDLRIRVSPRKRLLAALLSSLLAVALLRVWVADLGVAGLDWLFAIPPLAILITVIGTAGICHAFNLIDGVNGLAGTTASFVALGLAGIAAVAGDWQMASLALLLVAAILGFLVFNWPWGAVFLGDAGAYALGHLLSWIAILIVTRSPDVAGISASLLFFWPAADTLVAIWRRRAKGVAADQPDRQHLHQIAMRAIELSLGPRARRQIANPLATVILAPLVGLPVVAGVLFWNMAYPGLLALIGFSVLFVYLYDSGPQIMRGAARLSP